MPYDIKTDEEKLSEQLKKSDLSGVYIIYGNDTYLKQYYFDKLVSLSYSGDPFFNLQKFGYDCNIQDVYDAVNQFPLMSDSKCVVLDDYDIFTCSKDDFDRLCKVVPEVEQGCVFIIKFDYIDFDQKKESKVVRLTKAVQKAGGHIYNISHRSKAKLVRMLMKSAARRNITLPESEATYLVETVGEDLNILRNELEKLCLYRKDGKITREDILEVCVTDMNASVYDYVGCITDGDVSKALKLLDKMFFMRVDPYSILFNIGMVYCDMQRALAAKRSGKTKNDLITDFAYPDNMRFKIDRANRYLGRFDRPKIEKSFDCLIKTDKLLKSFGGDPRELLEQTTVELTAILWGAEF
ncbi:MAG: DNA polymerase III subunit delta [Clostridia bacterium]|nr:DNA polymerase III subunit delta [Clostridia bacterium]